VRCHRANSPLYSWSFTADSTKIFRRNCFKAPRLLIPRVVAIPGGCDRMIRFCFFFLSTIPLRHYSSRPLGRHSVTLEAFGFAQGIGCRTFSSFYSTSVTAPNDPLVINVAVSDPAVLRCFSGFWSGFFFGNQRRTTCRYRIPLTLGDVFPPSLNAGDVPSPPPVFSILEQGLGGDRIFFGLTMSR